MKQLLCLFSLVLLLGGCRREHTSPPAPVVPAAPAALAPDEAPVPGGVLVVDTQRSVVAWKGTKFWGTRKHEGVVRLASGTLHVHDGTLAGGTFTFDMHSIEVTDIPKSDPVPRKRLRDHLLSDHFFAVATYPTARFVLTRVEPVEGHTYRVTGDLTMRGRTHPVTFDARIPVLSSTSVQATAQLSIDRQVWGVAYRGSSLTNDLVDDEIHLDLTLFAARPGA